MPKSVVWIPLLLIGAMVYWTLALGFGGLSLMTISSFHDCEGDGPGVDSPSGAALHDSYQPIRVRIVGAADPAAEAPGEALDGDAVPLPVDLVWDVDRQSGESGQGAGGRAAGGKRSDPGPGETAF